MNKLWIVGLLALFCVFALVFMMDNVCADEIIVPDDYTTVKSAIENASSGDSIYIRNGIYNETSSYDLIVNKTLHIYGENRDLTKINTSGLAFTGGSLYLTENSTDSIIENLTFFGEGGRPRGILLGMPGDAPIVTNITIRNCVFTNLLYGIYLGYGVDGVLLENNIIYNNITPDFPTDVVGIIVGYSASNVTVRNNYIDDFTNGIYIGTTFGINRYYNNTINDTTKGIYLFYYTYVLSDNLIYDNYISNCTIGFETFGYGPSHSGNFVTNNVFRDNAKGMKVETNSDDNYFYHNSFINNTVHASGSGNNYWNNSFGQGNYWDNYTGSDLDGDGVGDTLLPHMGLDYYPLMAPFDGLYNVNGTLLDQDGNPVDNATIEVYDNMDNLVATVYTDSQGRFVVGLLQGDYRFVFTYSGNTFEQSVSVETSNVDLNGVELYISTAFDITREILVSLMYVVVTLLSLVLLVKILKGPAIVMGGE